jgi:hypothetical protein
MDRREFGIEAALALLGGALITISGCESATDPGEVVVDLQGEIAGNHGHVATLVAADLRAGSALDLDIRGSAGHTHTVSLTTVELALIRNGARIEKESTGTKHTHNVSFQI